MALPYVTIESARIVNDPELRYTPSGAAVVSFRVACNSRRYNTQTGQWDEGPTTFLGCTAWKQLAENINTTLYKGMSVNLTGKLQQDSYEKDGRTIQVYDLLVDDIGPSLKWATAQVTKNERNQQPQQGWGQQPQGQWQSQEAPF